MDGVRAEVLAGNAPRGVKRNQDDALDDDQRFAKRFNLLNLDHNGKLYIPVSSRPQHSQAAPAPAHVKLSPPPLSSSSSSSSGHALGDEYMQLDDTKDRIYIHNLDDELADIEPDEQQRLVFLPDIEKQFTKIPKHVLTGTTARDTNQGQELVLYGLPASLSVPAEHDSVRKAILEARQRARDRAVAAAETINNRPDQSETAHGLGLADYYDDAVGLDQDDDPDAMDIE